MTGGNLVPVEGVSSQLYALEVWKVIEQFDIVLLVFFWTVWWDYVLLLWLFELWWQINPDKSLDEFRTASQKLGGGGAKSLMQSMGLGGIADQVVCAFWV